jgi:hypothetical protein
MTRAQQDALSRPFRRSGIATEREVRVCDHPGCEEEGVHRAPRSRERLNEYFWFCLDHVRAYNRSWNYFAGMSEDEIESERQRDTTWHRPSWPFGSIGQGPTRHATGAFRDHFGFFDEESEEEARARRAWHEERRQRRREGTLSEEDEALDVLALEPPVTFTEIKARYKELVKRLHPDANGGDRSQEDKLKTVNRAYATLRSRYAK